MTREGMVPTADAYTGLVEALGHAAMYEVRIIIQILLS